jgi:hypothetical protein
VGLRSPHNSGRTLDCWAALPRTADAGVGAGKCIESFGSDRATAARTGVVGAGVDSSLGGFDGVQLSVCFLNERVGLLSFPRNGVALGVMLVISCDIACRLDDVLEALSESFDSLDRGTVQFDQSGVKAGQWSPFADDQVSSRLVGEVWDSSGRFTMFSGSSTERGVRRTPADTSCDESMSGHRTSRLGGGRDGGRYEADSRRDSSTASSDCVSG